MALRSVFVALVAAFLLAACNSMLVSPYDPAIEAGLDDYSKSMSAFLKSQEQNTASATSLYSSTQSKEFYRDSEATLSNVILHAEAVSNRPDCVPQLADNFGLTQLISGIDSAREFQGLPDDDPTLSVNLQSGSCTVVALKAVRANNSILEAMHRKNGRLSPGAAMLVRGLLEDSIRIALRIEKAKRV
jgi:hypothetical protein